MNKTRSSNPWRVALWALALSLLGMPDAFAQRMMIVHGGTLIDGNGEPPLQNATIVINGDRIQEIRTGESQQSLPPGATVVDARGKFIIPGLQDGHVHYREWMPPLFINHGITTIHDIGTNPPEWIMAQREMLQKEKIVGPRLYTSVLNLWGKSVPEGLTGFIGFETPQEARQWAQKAVELKADYIKVHEGFTGEMLIAVAQVAKEHNLPLVGHVPPVLDGFQAAEGGQTFFEHSSGVGRAIMEDPEEIQRVREERTKAYEGRNDSRHDEEFVAFYNVDPVKEGRMIRLLVAKNIFLEAEWVDPAKFLNRHEKEWAYEDLVFLSRPDVGFIPKNIRDYWLDYSGREAYTESLRSKLLRGFENWQKFMVKFSAAGGKIVVGTAAPNSVPGLDVHRDMQLLADAGLPLMKVLQAATKNTAEMTRKQKDLGTLEPGKYADLLVLDANPLEDITHTRKIHHVIKGGQIIERRYAGFRNPLPSTEQRPQTDNANPHPTVSGIEPAVTVEGITQLKVILKGKGFLIGSLIHVNGIPIQTTFKNATTLEGLIPTELLLTAGTFPVHVVNPEPLPPGEHPEESNKVMLLVKFR